MAEDRRDIENFFKKALDGYEGDIPFNESHWNQMAEMLDAEMPVVSSPSATYYYGSNIVSSIAAGVLIFGFIWNYNVQKQNDIITNREIASAPEQVQDQTEVPISENQPLTEVVESTSAQISDSEGQSKSIADAEPEEEMVPEEKEASSIVSLGDEGSNAEIEALGDDQVADVELPQARESNTKAAIVDESTDDTSNSIDVPPTEVASTAISADNDPVTTKALVLSDVQKKSAQVSYEESELPVSVQPHIVAKTFDQKVEEVIKAKADSYYPRFATTIVFSPDLSSNELGRYNKFGNEFGLLFEYRFTRRFSVEAGGLLSSKNYQALASDYKPPTGFWMTATGGEIPSSLTAVCRVVDIPINLKYRAVEDDKNVLAASAGVSSYFMLKEDYEFDMSWGAWAWEAEGVNQHIFGVANIQLHYERKLGKLFSIEVAPHAKIPLTGYGHGRIKFHSLGTSIGVKRYFRLRSSKIID